MEKQGIIYFIQFVIEYLIISIIHTNQLIYTNQKLVIHTKYFQSSSALIKAQ